MSGNLTNNKKRSGFLLLTLILEIGLAVYCFTTCASGALADLPRSWIFNASADMVCMLFNIFLYFGTMYGRKSMGKVYVLFLGMCICNFLAMFFDFQSWVIDGNPDQRTVIIAVNTILYMLNQVITDLYIRFISEIVVDNRKEKKMIIAVADSLLLITLITRLLNIRFGWFFTVSEAGVYHRGPYQFVTYFYSAVCQVIAVILIVRHSKDPFQRITVLAFTLVPFAAAVVSIFYYGLSVTYACILLSLLTMYSTFYLSIETDRSRIRTIFSRFLSTDVVNQLVNESSNVLVPGKRYQATIFVSDLRGFTAMAEKMEPERLVDMLNHFFGVVSEVVSSYGGIITEFLGDGVMVVFGAPSRVPDHADRAIAAALKLQETMPEINRWNKENGFPMIETGIGINTGSVVMGSLGSTRKARYMAVGNDVDRTFQIESCSVGGQVLASGNTVNAVKAKLETRFTINYSSGDGSLSRIPIYDVRKIGDPWNVGTETNYRKAIPVKEPVPADYYIVNGKHTDVEKHPVEIVKLSEDAAALKMAPDLSPLDNIRLEIEGFGTVFAKVTSVRQETTLVRFTSRPEGLEEWVRSKTGM